MDLTWSDQRLYWLGLGAGAFSVLNFPLLIVVGRLGDVGETLTVSDQAALIAIPLLAENPSALALAGIAVVAAGVLLAALPGLRHQVQA